jgi:purine-binding chemotaxis protein CheW
MHDESKAGKLIVFKIADYLLALPISDVLKVINCSAVENRGLRTMGVIQLGPHTIRILDLHLPQLNSGGLPQLPGNQPFLVITRTPQGELYAIAVDEPPNLMEIPLEMMRSLPPSHRQSSGLEMVSHAAVISQDEVTTTIFLLDVKRILNTAIKDSHPLSLRPS